MRKITHICIDGQMINDGYSHGEAAVYSCLWQLYYYGENKLPTITEIANSIHFSDKHVQRTIKKLISNNLLHIYIKNDNRYFYCYLDKYMSHPGVNPEIGYTIGFKFKIKLRTLKTMILKR